MTSSSSFIALLLVLSLVGCLLTQARAVNIYLRPGSTNAWDGGCISGNTCANFASNCGLSASTAVSAACDLYIVDDGDPLLHDATIETSGALSIHTMSADGGNDGNFESEGKLIILATSSQVTFQDFIMNNMSASVQVNASKILIQDSMMNITTTPTAIYLQTFYNLTFNNSTIRRSITGALNGVVVLSPDSTDSPVADDVYLNVQGSNLYNNGPTETAIFYQTPSVSPVTQLLISQSEITNVYPMTNFCPLHMTIENGSNLTLLANFYSAQFFGCSDSLAKYMSITGSTLFAPLAMNPANMVRQDGDNFERLELRNTTFINCVPANLFVQETNIRQFSMELYSVDVWNYPKIFQRNITTNGSVTIDETAFDNGSGFFQIHGCIYFPCRTFVSITNAPIDKVSRVGFSGNIELTNHSRVSRLEVFHTVVTLWFLNLTATHPYILEITEALSHEDSNITVHSPAQLKLWSGTTWYEPSPVIRSSDLPIIFWPGHSNIGLVGSDGVIDESITFAIDLETPSGATVGNTLFVDRGDGLGPMPEIGVPYPLFDSAYTGSDPTNIVSSLDPRYNITGFQSDTYSVLHWILNTVECPSSCNLDGIASSGCYRSDICACSSAWGGSLCDCNRANLPQGVDCSSQGGSNWLVEGDFSTTSAPIFILPARTSLTVNGNADLSGNINIQTGAKINVTAQSTQNGVIDIECKLMELRSPNGCQVVPDVSINAGNLIFTNATEIYITLDMSQISTDGSCVPPSDLDSNLQGLFTSLASTAMSSNALWNVTFVLPTIGTKRSDNGISADESFSLNITLVNSGSRITSTGSPTRLASSGPSETSCRAFSSSPGLLSVFVGSGSTCQTPDGTIIPSPATDSSSGGVKWYYYGIPIICVAVIAVLVISLVLTVPSCRNKVMPYHKSG